MRLRRIAFCVALVAACALDPRAARAQVFGQFSGAEPVPYNTRLLGGFMITSDAVLGALGQLRMSLYPAVDFGFQAGLSRLNLDTGNRTLVRFGVDMRAAVKSPDDRLPVTISIGGAIGVENSDEFSVLTLGPQVLVSRTWSLGGTTSITPYGGVLLAFSRADVDDEEISDVSLPLRLGGDLQVAPAMRLVLELQLTAGNQIADNFQIAAGAQFPF